MNFYKLIKRHPRNILRVIGFKIAAITRYLRNSGPISRTRPRGYKLVFSDNFTIAAELDEKKWGYAESWGWFHLNHMSVYHDRGMDGTVVVRDDQPLQLKTMYKPITIEKGSLPKWRQDKDLPEEFTIPWCTGKLYSKKAWQYGWFEAEIKLPKGKGLWPAFWLTGKNSWPPEIDILEAYSGQGSPLVSKLLGFKRINWNIEPTIHFGSIKDDTKDGFGGYEVPVAGATDRFVRYALHWTKDFIKVYYDGYLVFHMTDKDVLQHFNQKDAQMRVILNNNILSGEKAQPSSMEVKYIKIYQ